MTLRSSTMWIGMLMGSLLISAHPLGAEEHAPVCPVCSKAGDQTATYSSKAGYTLVRGAANVLFGWTEVIRQPAEEVKGGGNVLFGMAKGLGRGVQRTLAGAGEALTFWTPKVQDKYIHFSDDCPVCMRK